MRIVLKRSSHIVRLFFMLFFLICFSIGTVSAQTGSFETLQKKLATDGFDSKIIDTLYQNPNVLFDHRSVSLFFMHSEGKLNYGQFTSSKSIKNAKKYQGLHAQALAQAEKKYRVDQEIITAIILVETRLGKMLGKSWVFNALSTTAILEHQEARQHLWEMIPEDRRLSRNRFEKKADIKSGWAYKELKALIRYTVAEGIDPTAIKGSYAGAMGICQFMPSNIGRLAVDGDGDGRIDLFNHNDAIASVGNYLKHHGWKPGLGRKKSHKVVRRYNNSRPYADTILAIANLLRD